jgi:hypothetical protein
MTYTPDTPIPAAYMKTILGEPTLTSFWELQELSGTVAADSKGTNTGTYQNALTLGSSGFASGVVAINQGGTGYVTTTNSLTAPSIYSLECLQYSGSSTNGGYICFTNTQTSNPTTIDRALYLGSDTPKFDAHDTGGMITLSAPSTSTLSVWHHLVATYGTHGCMALYLDGVLIAFDPTARTPQSYTGYWRLGDYTTNGGHNLFQWGFACAAVYSSALSPQAVKRHFDAMRAQTLT